MYIRRHVARVHGACVTCTCGKGLGEDKFEVSCPLTRSNMPEVNINPSTIVVTFAFQLNENFLSMLLLAISDVAFMLRYANVNNCDSSEITM